MPGLIDVHVHIFLSASTEKQLLEPGASFDEMTARAFEESKAMLMRGLLFGVQAWDVPTLGAVAVVLGVAALAASYVPARRAASVNASESWCRKPGRSGFPAASHAARGHR